MDKLKGVPNNGKANFEDWELDGKNKPTVSGPAIGEDATKYARKIEHPNQADVSMQRLLDSNGKK